MIILNFLVAILSDFRKSMKYINLVEHFQQLYYLLISKKI